MTYFDKFMLRLGVMLFCLPVIQAIGQSSNDALQRYAEEGQRALTEGRYDVAERDYKQVIQINPQIAEAHASLGLVYFQQRRFELAVPELRQALKIKPSLQKLNSLLAMSLSELGEYKEALPGLEKEFHQSTDLNTRRMCGLQLERAYTALQRNGQAVQTALEMDRFYPNDPEVLYHSEKIYGNAAYLAIQKLVKEAPDSAWSHLAAAEAFESQGEADRAIAEYRTVLSLDPPHRGVHYRIGRTLLARSRKSSSAKDTSEALSEFQQELEFDPSNGNAAYEAADIYRNTGKTEEARKLFESALTYYPNFEEAYLGLAAVLMEEQQPERALPELQKAIALNTTNEVAWYRLAQVQKMLGNSVEVKKALTEFQRLHQQTANKNVASPDEVTKQEIDGNVPQP